MRRVGRLGSLTQSLNFRFVQAARYGRAVLCLSFSEIVCLEWKYIIVLVGIVVLNGNIELSICLASLHICVLNLINACNCLEQKHYLVQLFFQILVSLIH